MFFPTSNRGIFSDKENRKVSFVPFIKRLKLDGYYVILHWNKMAQKWGFYEGNLNRYYLADANVIAPITCKHELIDVFAGSLPSCVILYRNCSIIIKNQILTIQEVNHETIQS